MIVDRCADVDWWRKSASADVNPRSAPISAAAPLSSGRRKPLTSESQPRISHRRVGPMPVLNTLDTLLLRALQPCSTGRGVLAARETPESKRPRRSKGLERSTHEERSACRLCSYNLRVGRRVPSASAPAPDTDRSDEGADMLQQATDSQWYPWKGGITRTPKLDCGNLGESKRENQRIANASCHELN